MPAAAQATAKPTALLVVDLQQGVVSQCVQADAVLARVAEAVAQARAHGLPVVWVQHEDEELVHGSAAWQWAPPLAPAEGERRIFKRHNSSFAGTPLADELARLGVGHLLLAGAASNWCIRATAYAALERGFDLTLIADAHTTGPTDLPDGRRIDAEPVMQDLNVTLSWLSYPGCRNQAQPLADLAWDHYPRP